MARASACFFLCWVFFVASVCCYECQVRMIPYQDSSCETLDPFAKQYLQSLCAERWNFLENVSNMTLGPVVAEANCSARTLVFFPAPLSSASSSSSSLGAEEEPEVCEGLEFRRVYRHGDCFRRCGGGYVAPVFGLADKDPCTFDEPQVVADDAESSSPSSADVPSSDVLLFLHAALVLSNAQ
ncbi:hypothetical protein QOT17_012283 [Balamuthia mandrillaris]